MLRVLIGHESNLSQTVISKFQFQFDQAQNKKNHFVDMLPLNRLFIYVLIYLIIYTFTYLFIDFTFKVDRLLIILVAKRYLRVATVHQLDA